MNKKLLAKEIVKIAMTLFGMEFDSQEALDKYLKEHPDADKSNHSVKKQEEKPKTEGEKKENSKSSYSDKVKAIKEEHDKKMKAIYDEHANSPDFSDRPNESTKDIRKEVWSELSGGGTLKSGTGEVSHGVTDKKSVKSKLEAVKKILEKHKIKTPEKLSDIAKMKDGDGHKLINLYGFDSHKDLEKLLKE
jgi:hypothetical protein